MSLGRGQLVDEAPGEHVHQLDLGVADDEAPRRPDDDSDLDRQWQHGAGGGDDLADARHGVLHGERAGGGADAVVTVEPAGHGVATEVDDVTAEAVELCDHARGRRG